MRRNIVIIDDIPKHARPLVAAIESYYNNKPHVVFNLVSFFEEHHFEESKKYITDNLETIDIICSDQNLGGGNAGTTIFRSLGHYITEKFESVKVHPFIFRVMHSNDNVRLVENQDTYRYHYDYFVNSMENNGIIKFLDYYETNIATVKMTGNPNYHVALQRKHLSVYRNPAKLDWRIGNETIKLRDILFMVLDKSKTHLEHYYVVYKTDEAIVYSDISIKPVIHDELRELLFVEGYLQGTNTLCKINSLWISSLSIKTSMVTIFTPFSYKFEVSFSSFKPTPHIPFEQGLVPFFTQQSI